jgi:L-ribulose-5-phosphate 3-epimerase
MELSYGYVTNGLSNHRLDDALGLLADCGYDGVALTLDHSHFDAFAPDLEGRAASLRRRLDALGLRCVIETGARFALDPRRKHHPTLLSAGRERRLEFLIRSVDVAAEAEAPVVSIWSGALELGADPDRAWEHLLDGCGTVVAHAEERGITIGFEPEPGMLVERLSQYERLADELGHPRGLGVTLDLGHCVCVEPEATELCIARAAPTLAHVHAADMLPGVHEHLLFGEGDLDLDTALAALRAVGYDGLVAVELSRHSHVAHEVVPAAMESLRAAEREWVLR